MTQKARITIDNDELSLGRILRGHAHPDYVSMRRAAIVQHNLSAKSTAEKPTEHVENASV